MRSDKDVANALEVLEFKVIARDLDGTLMTFKERPFWDNCDGVFYSTKAQIMLDSNQFKNIDKGELAVMFGMEFDDKGDMIHD